MTQLRIKSSRIEIVDDQEFTIDFLEIHRHGDVWEDWVWNVTFDKKTITCILCPTKDDLRKFINVVNLFNN